MRLYDTCTGIVAPLNASNGVASLYVCGVTPYDTTHLGHARTYVVFDVLVRYLRHTGLTVRYVQNVTDVDDPLFERARQLGVPPGEIADKYFGIYLADMAALNVLPPDAYPRVSDSVPDIVEVVRGLLSRGCGYAGDGHVYFRVKAAHDYGQLSHLSRAEMLQLSRERGENPDDPRKLDPLDFILWKPSGTGEPSWPSPWGKGRPGWHVECSTFVSRHLGPTVDVHGGGADLIYPHHENEIAQSECLTGRRPFAGHWAHVGMVRLGGTKMSKSLGNVVFVRDLLTRFSPDAIRLYLLSLGYRQPLDFREEDITEYARLANDLARVAQLAGDAEPRADAPDWLALCLTALDEDLDTPRLLKVLRQMVANRAAGWAQAVGSTRVVRDACNILGLRLVT